MYIYIRIKIDLWFPNLGLLYEDSFYDVVKVTFPSAFFFKRTDQ